MNEELMEVLKKALASGRAQVMPYPFIELTVAEMLEYNNHLMAADAGINWLMAKFAERQIQPIEMYEQWAVNKFTTDLSLMIDDQKS